MANQEAILITGASGNIGRQFTASVLRYSDAQVLAMIRQPDHAQSLRRQLLAQLQADGVDEPEARVQRVDPILWSQLEQPQRFAGYQVREVFHGAASMNYQANKELRQVNVELTRRLLQRALDWPIDRFIYLSTAFASGYRSGPIPEALHAPEQEDPSGYTLTKRQAENLVAQSGMPWLILRPSVVIGDSLTGAYEGRLHGLYQFWATSKRLFRGRENLIRHVVAPNNRVPLVHQDALRNAIEALWRSGARGSAIHLSSAHEALPSYRDLTMAWLRQFNLDEERLVFYERLEDIPRGVMDLAHRVFYRQVADNLNIASHPWAFQTDRLRGLRDQGLDFRDATLASVTRCMEVFDELETLTPN